MTINTCLEKIEDITRQNLELLKTINQAFTTKHEHLAVVIDGTQYMVPSFISLENKINTLQQNLENIVNAPSTGECFTFFDGTTQRLELSGYSTTPVQTQPDASRDSDNKAVFGVEQNDIFKDFLNPMPYARILLGTIPNNVKTVCVKKVALKNQQLIDLVLDSLGEQSTDIDTTGVVNIDYGTLKAMLFNYIEDTDYVDYDTIRRIPVRKSQGYGMYTIHTINRVWEDNDFTQYYDLTFNEDLIYTVDDGTIDRNISVGDKLVTSNSRVICEVTELHPASRTLTVKVLYGGYVDLTTAEQSEQLGTLMFYSSIEFDNTKYIDVPLEEDQYVCIFVASVNDTTNTRGAWAQGLLYNTDMLKIYIDGKEYKFRKYYNENVNNIGDTLYDITKFMNSSMYNMSREEMQRLVQYKPVIEQDRVTVTQINKHLNDSDTVKKIRNLYSQKSKYKSELDTVQTSINNINNILSSIAFDYTDNNRAMYESQLSELNAKKAELTASVMSIANEINANVNSADTPIENAKYHIRGFVDVTIPQDITVEGTPFDVIKIDVEYRYRNRNKMSGNAETIGENEIFSDWNRMDSVYRDKLLKTNNEGIVYPFQFDLEPTNDTLNVISFNQIDIPITQGEIVDIRYRYQYSLGFPFVKIYSSWSDIYTQTFPDEYLQNVPILSIIEENNDDIKKNAVSSMLKEKGITPHVDDRIVDQNVTYFHQPEHIASGFYTDERRIIPLYDMLQSMYSDLTDIRSEVYGTLSDNLIVSVFDDINTAVLQRDIQNNFYTSSFMSNDNKQMLGTILGLSPNNVDGTYTTSIYNEGIAYSQININLYNAGSYPLRLHSLFPGDPSGVLGSTTPGKYSASDYSNTADNGNAVYMLREGGDNNNDTRASEQVMNQILYFRIKTANGEPLYTEYTGSNPTSFVNWNDSPAYSYKYAVLPKLGDQFTNAFVSTEVQDNDVVRWSTLFPYVAQDNTLIIGDSNAQYITINPGESVNVPLSFYYYMHRPNDNNTALSVHQSIEFDVRTSLFSDPVTYKVSIIADYYDTVAKKGLKKIVVQNAEGIAAPTNAATAASRHARRAQAVVNDGTSTARPRRR
jgi:hypothetical protein